MHFQKKIYAKRLSISAQASDVIHLCARKRTIFEHTCVQMVHILLDWLNVSILDYEVKWWRNVKTVSLKYHKEITTVRKNRSKIYQNCLQVRLSFHDRFQLLGVFKKWGVLQEVNQLFHVGKLNIINTFNKTSECST